MKDPVVLVLRADDSFSAGLRQFGAEVLNLSLIDVQAVGDDTAITDAIGRLRDYDGLFFTSSFAASIFLERLGRGRDILDTHIYVLGMRARRVFDRAGISVHYRGEANTAAEMIGAFGIDQFAGKKMLFVRGDRSMRTIPDMLAGKAVIDELVVYRTVDTLPDPAMTDALRGRMTSGEIDWLCFFSPSGVDAFKKLFDHAASEVRTAVIGQTTAAAARQAGLKVELVSQRANAGEFAAELRARMNTH